MTAITALHTEELGLERRETHRLLARFFRAGSWDKPPHSALERFRTTFVLLGSVCAFTFNKMLWLQQPLKFVCKGSQHIPGCALLWVLRRQSLETVTCPLALVSPLNSPGCSTRAGPKVSTCPASPELSHTRVSLPCNKEEFLV